MTQEILTQERLKELLCYNPETGIFTWIVGKSNVIAGTVARTIRKDGYVDIRIDNTKYQAHRLAFLYMVGSFPTCCVDHINRKQSDNRWCNLRAATRRQNSENKSNNNAFIGVGRSTNRKKWQAISPRINGVQKHLGTFKTHLAACYARHAWEMSQ